MLRRSWRCMNSRSRKPAVAMNATGAPLRSSTALVAPMSGLLGVLGTLVTTIRPPSTATRSVKVPPTSTPTRMPSGSGVQQPRLEIGDLLLQLFVFLARLGGHGLHGVELVAPRN